MNKRRILPYVIFCFIGAMLSNGVFAVQSYQHISDGDTLAGFQGHGSLKSSLKF